MTQSFQEFLEEKRIDFFNMPNEIIQKIIDKKGEKDYFISVKDLGKWAFKKHIELQVQMWGCNKWSYGCHSPYSEIAIICLGKEEIEKRLKGLKL